MKKESGVMQGSFFSLYAVAAAAVGMQAVTLHYTLRRYWISSLVSLR